MLVRSPTMMGTSVYRANKDTDADNARDIHKAVNAGMHMVRVDCLDQIGP